MGTTYHITYFDEKGRNFKKSVDSLLRSVNQSINTYDPEAEVSVFNQSEGGFQFVLPYLRPPLEVSKFVYEESGGAFDPTVMPLVNAWGFGRFKDIPLPDSFAIDSIRSFIGFDNIQFNEDSVWKENGRIQLDFGGIGQGYGADVITSFLQEKVVMNMLVELGGEGMAIGRNMAEDRPWEIGILDPNSLPDNLFFKAYVTLEDKSFTTSGSYFNYRIVDGQKFSHTIDPKNGYPVNRNLLSVSVFTDNCTTADAWATAFMTMGHSAAMDFLERHPDIDALLIYSKEDGSLGTYVTPGLVSSISFQ